MLTRTKRSRSRYTPAPYLLTEGDAAAHGTRVPTQPAPSALRLPSVASLDTESLAELPDPTELEAWLAFSPPDRGPADGGLIVAAGSAPSPAPGAPSSYQPSVPYVQVTTRQSGGCLDTLWAARYWEQAGDATGWSLATAPRADSRIFSGIPIKSEQVVLTPTSSSAVSVSDASPSILGQAASGTPRIGAPLLPPLAPPPFKFIIDPAYGAALRLA